MEWKTSVLSLLTGLIVGVIFSMLKLPLPAPPVLSGVLGIIGIWLGSVVYQWMIHWISRM
jgi:XapX domain-containing protein